MKIIKAVKLRIEELCKERNITINKLCTMSGITQSTVNSIISGRNNGTNIVIIKEICDGLNISIQDFFNSDVFKDLEQEIK